MGCCESKISAESNIEFHRRYYSTGVTNHRENRESLKAEPKYNISLKINENFSMFEIPKTREVRVPNCEIPIEIIKNKKRLTLTIIESKYLTEGTVLNISPGGLDGSERQCRDGVVIFGTRNDEIVNDFNFPDEDTMGKRHFEIKYEISKDTYKIKNLFGSGLFVKIKNRLVRKLNIVT